MILRSYKPDIDYSTQLTTDKNMKAKTCATEEEECDQTRDSALPLLDTGTGAEFQNPSYSLGHDVCIFLDIFNRYYNKSL